MAKERVEEVRQLSELTGRLARMKDDEASVRAVTQVLDTWPDHHARLRELRQAASSG
ncbi:MULTISPECIES: hypothetical protein [unclassified Streptomyces]|uniref:hypothetical protein n=1 Tax=unclassified Streptomyces TaxID=2593676 RepID=UPI001EF11725|nr:MULTISPECIES: hypothetical protein [unclassified Streptomyces]